MLGGNQTSSSQTAATMITYNEAKRFLIVSISHKFYAPNWSVRSTCFDFTTTLQKKDNADMIQSLSVTLSLTLRSYLSALHAFNEVGYHVTGIFLLSIAFLDSLHTLCCVCNAIIYLSFPFKQGCSTVLAHKSLVWIIWLLLQISFSFVTHTHWGETMTGECISDDQWWWLAFQRFYHLVFAQEILLIF